MLRLLVSRLILGLLTLVAVSVLIFAATLIVGISGTMWATAPQRAPVERV